MSPLTLRQLDSAAELRASAPAWDDLWCRSGTTIPTARAELAALWLDHFAPGALFHALVIEQDGRMLAALPLVEKKVGWVVRCGGLTSNYWSPNGELLLDPGADCPAVLNLLIDGLEKLDWPLFWFDMVPVDSPHWRSAIAVMRERGMALDIHHRWQVGQIELEGGVEAYFAARSKNHRRKLRRHTEQLEETAPLELRLEDHFSPKLIEERLREIFTIEDRTWKGAAGGSVLRQPAMFEFYRQQAVQLAQWDSLRIARLLHGERTIAYELGWVGDRVFHCFKIGYDPDYSRQGPGHLLLERMVRTMAERGDIRAIDFQGPQTQALASWSTRQYPIARLVIGQRNPTGRVELAGYRALAKTVRALRKIPRPW